MQIRCLNFQNSVSCFKKWCIFTFCHPLISIWKTSKCERKPLIFLTKSDSSMTISTMNCVKLSNPFCGFCLCNFSFRQTYLALFSELSSFGNDVQPCQDKAMVFCFTFRWLCTWILFMCVNYIKYQEPTFYILEC